LRASAKAGNAIKFTAEGGKVGLVVRADEAASTIQFSVWDTGTGIAPQDLKLLFQPFVQLESSHLCQQTGTGLGLFLVARMAQLHGGSVSVASEPGKGSCFTITLPWHQRQHVLVLDTSLPNAATESLFQPPAAHATASIA
jgi:signal transduction histidine kinase